MGNDVVESSHAIDNMAISNVPKKESYDGLKLHGHLDVRVKHPDGTEKILCDKTDNFFTADGIDHMLLSFYNETAGNYKGPAIYLGVSSDTGTTVTKTRSELAGEIITGGLERAKMTTKGAHTDGTNTSISEHTFIATAVHTDVTKAAVFTRLTGTEDGNIMTNIAPFDAPETLQINSQLTVKWTFQLGS